MDTAEKRCFLMQVKFSNTQTTSHDNAWTMPTGYVPEAENVKFSKYIVQESRH